MDLKPGQMVKVTIAKPVRSAAARKTLERLFMKDAGIAGPLEARSANFYDKPKRRGGCIWTKYDSKLHPKLNKGVVANLKVTMQVIADLNSVKDLVQLSAA